MQRDFNSVVLVSLEYRHAYTRLSNEGWRANSGKGYESSNDFWIIAEKESKQGRKEFVNGFAL